MSKPNAHQIRKLFDTVNDAREALRLLGHDVELWDPIHFSKVTRFFDLDTRSFYELTVAAELSKDPTKNSWMIMISKATWKKFQLQTTLMKKLRYVLTTSSRGSYFRPYY